MLFRIRNLTTSHLYITGYKNTLDKEEQIKYLQSKGTDYVVLEQLGYSSTGRYLFPAIQRYPKKFKVIIHLKNPDTYLMKFLPELGYWGEWKDNLRNGKGTLYFPNGQQLEGVWTNDVLNGEVILRSKEGDVIQKSIYKNNIKIIVINEDK